MPSHNHATKAWYMQEGYGATIPVGVHYLSSTSGVGWNKAQISNQNVANILDNLSTGSSKAHNNLQPYLSVYIWERVA